MNVPVETFQVVRQTLVVLTKHRRKPFAKLQNLEGNFREHLLLKIYTLTRVNDAVTQIRHFILHIKVPPAQLKSHDY